MLLRHSDLRQVQSADIHFKVKAADRQLGQVHNLPRFRRPFFAHRNAVRQSGGIVAIHMDGNQNEYDEQIEEYGLFAC